MMSNFIPIFDILIGFGVMAGKLNLYDRIFRVFMLFCPVAPTDKNLKFCLDIIRMFTILEVS